MVIFEPMSEELFHDYFQKSVAVFAKEHVRTGNWEESESMRRAEDQLQEILPQGSQTEGHHFCKIVDEITKHKVGFVWFTEVFEGDKKVIFLYDLIVDEDCRQRGYGKQAMHALEGRASSLGARSIYLHVFAHNKVAKSLYDKLGYEIVKTYYDKVNNGATSFRLVKTVRISS